MLGLDVQEKSQLQLLESSLSNTVNHKWPILHVHFIEEPISNWNIKGDLTTANHKQPLPHTHIVNSAEFIQESERASSTGCQDCTGNYSLNSAVMLGTVERAAPMDISGSTQKIDHQEVVSRKWYTCVKSISEELPFFRFLIITRVFTCVEQQWDCCYPGSMC